MKSSARHKGRKLALQAIYQWQFTSETPSNIIVQFYEKKIPQNVDFEYFTKLLNGVISNQSTIDECMLPFLDRPITDINPVEMAILRLAIYELMSCLDVPYRVVINESLELTKTFGQEEGFKYVNGILDKVSRKVRAAEMQKN